jgi:DNA-binding HxlR family transcriptional regulator
MKKQDKEPGCPAEAAIDLMGGRWKAVILYWLREGPTRFGELHRLIPKATQQMLTQQLRQLETDGLVHREIFKEVPPRVEYSLTPRGDSLSPILDALCKWGETHANSFCAVKESKPRARPKKNAS